MDSKKSNKIRDIVRLQQLLKKWKAFAKNNSQNRNRLTGNTTQGGSGSGSGSGSKGIKFLKKTLSFSDSSVSSHSSFASMDVVPKGFLAVCVGNELKRYVIPTEYLSHQAFGMLLRDAEEEFGFQQEGVLKIPCEVSVFEMILKVVEDKREDEFSLHDHLLPPDLRDANVIRCSPDCDQMFPSAHASSNVHMIH